MTECARMSGAHMVIHRFIDRNWGCCMSGEGSSFESFLQEEGIAEEVNAAAIRSLTRTVLERERIHLAAMPINQHSPDLLKTAAPESYEIILRYLDRRIASL